MNTPILFALRPPVLALLVALSVTLLPGAPAADASFPGRNGEIAFVGADYPEDGPEPIGTGLWIGRPGGPLRQLTDDPSARSPAFSPDGRWLVFSRATAPAGRNRLYPRRAIFLMRADGTGLTQLTDGAAEDLAPTFSAGGRSVLFARSPAGGTNGDDIYSVGVDGIGLRRLTAGPATDARPAASPNGRVVAFDRRRAGRTRVFTMRPNGTRVRNATRGLGRHDDAIEAEFSPSGRQIAYARVHDGRPSLFLMRPNGRKPRPLPGSHRCSGCPIHRSATFSPDGRAVLAGAGRNFRYFLVRIPLRNPKAARALNGFGGPQDVIEPAWQPLPLG